MFSGEKLAKRNLSRSVSISAKRNPLPVGRCASAWLSCRAFPRNKGKEIIKAIKDSKLKVQAQIMDDQVRVSGKKIDDLQDVIQLLKGQDLGIELQFVNMRS